MDSKTVMVVEDEELLLDAIKRKLELSGFTVLAFTSGKTALESLQKSTNPPDIIWLDYYLKDIDGLEFMQGVRSDARLVPIPVIVVSNSARPDKVSRMLALGVKIYILKAEHKLDDIIMTLKEYLAMQEKVGKGKDVIDTE